MCGPPGGVGVPASALSECSKLFPRGAKISPAIARHYRVMGVNNAVFCIAIQAGLSLWATEIEAAIADLTPERRWFVGLDTGSSSLAMFAVLANATDLRRLAGGESLSATPHDADDFGRCRRLIARFPEWRSRLHEVAAAYPETKWPQIVARWDELEAAAPTVCSQILFEIHHPQPATDHAKD